jgi:hypothetical protein
VGPPAGEIATRAGSKLEWLYRQHREMQARIQVLKAALPAASAARRSRSAEAGNARRRFAARPGFRDADCDPQPPTAAAEPAEPALARPGGEPTCGRGSSPAICWPRSASPFSASPRPETGGRARLFPVQVRLLMASVTAVAMIVFG